ncbi:cupin domain-containing protein [Microbulbifer agarilyticus]
MKSGNLFRSIPAGQLKDELFEALSQSESTLIERIISRGHKTPDGDWYDQTRAEWVVLLEGSAELEFEDGSIAHLERGDYLDIPAHCKHRVRRTSPDETCVWLAIHYCQDESPDSSHSKIVS